jgi:peptidoglycan/LPS O-acetylase OafA/YrhL
LAANAGSDGGIAEARFQAINNAWVWLADLGPFGVDIFFVLSGYIITLRLLKERQRSGSLNLCAFYIRRAFRILPPVVAYLSVLCLLSLFIAIPDLRASEILGALFFFRNYQYAAHPQGVWTGHFWSLSIEEHFYLLWPAVLLLLGSRRALWFALCGAFACALWRVWYLAHGGSIAHRLCTDVRCDGLLLGCALAILLVRPQVHAFILRNVPKEAPLLLAFPLLLNLIRTDMTATLLSSALITAILACTLVVEEGLVWKALNTRLMAWIGVVSYSLYIWQQVFLMRPPGFAPLSWLSSFPLNVLCVFTVSSLSYYCLEQPCIAFGKRLVERRATGSNEAIGATGDFD